MSKRFDDIDLMQYVDGEVDEQHAAEIAAHLERDGAARRKVRALEQMSEVMCTHLELAADDVEPRLDAMWATIERRIHANGSAVAAEVAPVPARRERDERQHERSSDRGERKGLLAAIGRWLDAHRGHFLTGAVCAGAAAALIVALRPASPIVIETPVAVRDREIGVNDPRSPEVKRVHDAPSPPEIEHLDVSGGSGSVFLMPSEDENDVSATVIFVDMTDVEGPL